MWVTVFVIDQKEHLSDRSFPGFQIGGKLFLYMRDTFTGKNVPKGYEITTVIYDLYTEKPRQYVYLSTMQDV